MNDAINFGQSCISYDTAISNLARRISTAMRFLVIDKNATELRGAPIITMIDVFNMARSKGFNPIVAEQSHEKH